MNELCKCGQSSQTTHVCDVPPVPVVTGSPQIWPRDAIVEALGKPWKPPVWDGILTPCSFCGKTKEHDRIRVIQGPCVSICVECVELCVEILKEPEPTEPIDRRGYPMINIINTVTPQVPAMDRPECRGFKETSVSDETEKAVKTLEHISAVRLGYELGVLDGRVKGASEEHDRIREATQKVMKKCCVDGCKRFGTLNRHEVYVTSTRCDAHAGANDWPRSPITDIARALNTVLDVR